MASSKICSWSSCTLMYTPVTHKFFPSPEPKFLVSKEVLGRVLNYRLLDCKWRFSALPFLKYALMYSAIRFSKPTIFATKSFNWWHALSYEEKRLRNQTKFYVPVFHPAHPFILFFSIRLLSGLSRRKIGGFMQNPDLKCHERRSLLPGVVFLFIYV